MDGSTLRWKYATHWGLEIIIHMLSDCIDTFFFKNFPQMCFKAHKLVQIEHWFREWLGAVRQQAISWTTVDKYPWCHIWYPGFNELKTTSCKQLGYITIPHKNSLSKTQVTIWSLLHVSRQNHNLKAASTGSLQPWNYDICYPMDKAEKVA